MPSKTLREGFTTGTAATAAAMAAVMAIFYDGAIPSVSVPLPPFEGSLAAGRIVVPVMSCARTGPLSGEATVRKDGGDDPDATRHALITAKVDFVADSTNSVVIEGGEGIGRVTMPGLPVAVGEAAINPVPRTQIAAGLGEVLLKAQKSGLVRVLLSVAGGEEMARHTLNSRLGIVGGISILGTHGIVRPFSHEAWQETIRQGIAVAKATFCPAICFSTGRRSEKMLMRLYDELPPQAFVQAADFAKFSLSQAGAMGFELIIWGCFFGKMLKLAQGMEYTHAREAPLDMNRLAELCARKDPDLAVTIKNCITANHALDLLLENNNGMDIIEKMADMAAEAAATMAGRPVRLHLFHLNGTEILLK